MTTTGTSGPPATRAPGAPLLLAATLFVVSLTTPLLATSGASEAAPLLLPEPGTLIFVTVAGLAMFIRRRNRFVR